nr:reverse transcriptase domain-containing protein [Tanacetum cinerariifolium]
MPNESLPDASVVETQQEPWTLFTNGLSCVDGSGAGLILTSLKGTEFTYALRFQFTAFNNEVEYEALIDDLRIATQMGVRNVYVSIDSKLVANQVLGAYFAKEENMIKYLKKVKSLVSDFTNFSINQVPRSKNKKADALSKIIEGGDNRGRGRWPNMDDTNNRIFERMTLPSDRKEARKLRIKARQYELLEGVLYRRSFLMPWLSESRGDNHRQSEAVIPAEIGMPTYRTAAVDAIHNDEKLRLNLDMLEERCERATIRKAKAKLKMTKYYNARVRGTTFRPGDFVYRSNDASHAVDGGKLGSK